MPTTQKCNFTVDQITNPCISSDTKIFSFEVDEQHHQVFITPKEDTSRVEFFEFSDNILLSLEDIAKTFNFPEIATTTNSFHFESSNL